MQTIAIRNMAEMAEFAKHAAMNGLAYTATSDGMGGFVVSVTGY